MQNYLKPWELLYQFDIYVISKFGSEKQTCYMIQQALWGCLVCVFKQQFSVFKQHFTHFHILFYPHVFSQIFSNNNFQLTKPYAIDKVEKLKQRNSNQFLNLTLRLVARLIPDASPTQEFPLIQLFTFFSIRASLFMQMQLCSCFWSKRKQQSKQTGLRFTFKEQI